jgi:hypothetical protein
LRVFKRILGKKKRKLNRRKYLIIPHGGAIIHQSIAVAAVAAVAAVIEIQIPNKIRLRPT